MDHTNHQTALLPIDHGVDWQWLEENWDPRAMIRLPREFSAPNGDHNRLTDRAPLNVFSDQKFMSGPVLQTNTPIPCPTEHTSLRAPSPPSNQHGKAQRGKAKTPKPRIHCPQPDCTATFPRQWELKRHQSNVHERSIIINCSVYGCSRISKPFYRIDKLREHMKKHENPHQFLCIYEDCRLGPFLANELTAHINLQHSFRDNLEQALISTNLRRTPLEDGSVILENRVNCPLAFLGCRFQHSIFTSKLIIYGLLGTNHIKEHDLLERSRGYEAVKLIYGWWTHGGIVICPVCRDQVCNSNEYITRFLRHIEHHSKEQRVLHASTFAQMLRPYLTGKELLFLGEDSFDELKTELEEAGFGTINSKRSEGESTAI